MPSTIIFVAALGCRHPEPVVDNHAPVPADLLLVRLAGPGTGDHVEVSGAIRDSAVLVDADAVWDDGYPIVIELLDADGEPIYATTRREPAQIRQAMAGYDIGVDLFTLLPELGDFAVAVPRDDRARDVRFWRREPDTSKTAAPQAVRHCTVGWTRGMVALGRALRGGSMHGAGFAAR